MLCTKALVQINHIFEATTKHMILQKKKKKELLKAVQERGNFGP
jgi:hypothetical protein